MRRYLGRNSLRCDLAHYCNGRMSRGGLSLYAAKLASFHRCNRPCQASPPLRVWKELSSYAVWGAMADLGSGQAVTKALTKKAGLGGVDGEQAMWQCANLPNRVS